MKTLNFECDDRYEAEKAGKPYVSAEGQHIVGFTVIQAVIGNEIVHTS